MTTKINGINNGLTITGNSVVPSATADPSQFYYFFYDMRVEILAQTCPTAKTPVTAINNVIPTITRSNDTLTSSIAVGNQWQLNGFDIQGEKGQKLKVTQSGRYRTSVVDDFKCESLSAEQDVTVTSVINVAPERIGFTVAPNPSNGNFFVAGPALTNVALFNQFGQKIAIELSSISEGTYQIITSNLANGSYILVLQSNEASIRKAVQIIQ